MSTMLVIVSYVTWKEHVYQVMKDPDDGSLLIQWEVVGAWGLCSVAPEDGEPELLAIERALDLAHEQRHGASS